MDRSEHKVRLRALVAAQQTRELSAAELREVAEHFDYLGDDRQARKARKAAKRAEERFADLDALFEPAPLPPPQPTPARSSSDSQSPLPARATESEPLDDQPLPVQDCGLAKASLVLAILGLLTAGIGSLLAIVTGLVALGQISGSGRRLSGRSKAVRGIVIGLLGAVGYAAAGALYLPVYRERVAAEHTKECARRIAALYGELKEYVDAHQGQLPAVGTPMADVLKATGGDPELAACPDGHPYAMAGYNLGGGGPQVLTGPVRPLLFEGHSGVGLDRAHRNLEDQLAGHVVFNDGKVRLTTPEVFQRWMIEASERLSQSGTVTIRGDGGSGVSMPQTRRVALDQQYQRIYASLECYAKANGGLLPRPGLDPAVVLDSCGGRAADWTGPSGRRMLLNRRLLGRSLAELKKSRRTDVLVFESPLPQGDPDRGDSLVLQVGGQVGVAHAGDLDRLL